MEGLGIYLDITKVPYETTMISGNGISEEFMMPLGQCGTKVQKITACKLSSQILFHPLFS